MDIKLPGVYRERARGKWRFRYQANRNAPKKTLRGEPGSQEFLDHYRELKAGNEKPPSQMGSIEWLRDLYLANFAKLVEAGLRSDVTLLNRRNILNRVCQLYPNEDMNIHPLWATEVRNRMAATPTSANNTIKTLRAMYSWAKEAGHVRVNPITGTAPIKFRTDGFTPWTMADLEKFSKRHPIGTKAHLTMSLALFTSARRSDLVILGRQHERQIAGATWLCWKQSKTAKGFIEIPMLPALLRETRMPCAGEMTYLLTKYGKPHSAKAFGNTMRVWCDQAGIYNKSLHGIRKAAGNLLAELGCSSYEIMALQGHSDPKSSEIYTRGARQRVLAESAMQKLETLKW